MGQRTRTFQNLEVILTPLERALAAHLGGQLWQEGLGVFRGQRTGERRGGGGGAGDLSDLHARPPWALHTHSWGRAGWVAQATGREQPCLRQGQDGGGLPSRWSSLSTSLPWGDSTEACPDPGPGAPQTPWPTLTIFLRVKVIASGTKCSQDSDWGLLRATPCSRSQILVQGKDALLWDEGNLGSSTFSAPFQDRIAW